MQLASCQLRCCGRSSISQASAIHRRATDIINLWVGLVVCIPNYYLAGALVEMGMSWWQGMAAVLLGNAITLLPVVANAHPGTKYGIPFPVLARASFGVRGAHIPAGKRAL